MGNTSEQQRLSLKNEVQLNILIQSAMLQFFWKWAGMRNASPPLTFKYTILNVYGNSEES